MILHRVYTILVMNSMPCAVLQGSVVVLYNWVSNFPHSWVTALIKDLALPIHFVGTSTDDRRFLYPLKEVGLHLNIAAKELLAWPAFLVQDASALCHLGLCSGMFCF